MKGHSRKTPVWRLTEVSFDDRQPHGFLPAKSNETTKAKKPKISNHRSAMLHSRISVFRPSNGSLWRVHSLRFISSLKVVWRKDVYLDEAIQRDKWWRTCTRVVKEVLNEPGQVIPLRYLEKRRERMRLKWHVRTFLNRYPGIFDIYYDRIKPQNEREPFLRPGDRLRRFLDEEKRIRAQNEPSVVAKLCKLLMMSTNKVISVDKLVHVKRDFGFPDDFLCNLVPKYPEYFRLVGAPGEGKSFLELVSWNQEFAKSVIESRAEKESSLTGIQMRPAFDVRMPPGFILKKEMREWVRDWMELPYISPYSDATHLDQASPEMEKRTVGVFHELLSLSLLRRVPVAILGKFCEDYRFSNAFANVFTRHSGIFYMSLKEGIKTAVLREAYRKSELIDKDPLHELKERFVEMVDESHGDWLERQRLNREAIQREMEMVAIRNAMETSELIDKDPDIKDEFVEMVD